MTVAELQDALRRIDPSRTVVVRQAGKGNGKVKARSAEERIMAVGLVGLYVPLESLGDGRGDELTRATVFVIE